VFTAAARTKRILFSLTRNIPLINNHNPAPGRFFGPAAGKIIPYPFQPEIKIKPIEPAAAIDYPFCI
jgi:hypothetical protein